MLSFTSVSLTGRYREMGERSESQRRMREEAWEERQAEGDGRSKAVKSRSRLGMEKKKREMSSPKLKSERRRVEGNAGGWARNAGGEFRDRGRISFFGHLEPQTAQPFLDSMDSYLLWIIMISAAAATSLPAATGICHFESPNDVKYGKSSRNTGFRS
jgi:hypothetical protein